jgi:hypothetical protein
MDAVMRAKTLGHQRKLTYDEIDTLSENVLSWSAKIPYHFLNPISSILHPSLSDLPLKFPQSLAERPHKHYSTQTTSEVRLSNTERYHVTRTYMNGYWPINLVGTGELPGDFNDLFCTPERFPPAYLIMERKRRVQS